MNDPIRFAEDDLEDHRRRAWDECCNEHDYERFVRKCFGGDYNQADDWKRGVRYVMPAPVPTEPDGTWGGYWPLRGGYPPSGYPPKGQSVVYVLRDAMGRPLYVGSTDDFRARAAQHYRAGKRWETWTAVPYPSRLAAYKAENAYLAERIPPLNRQTSRRRFAG